MTNPMDAQEAQAAYDEFTKRGDDTPQVRERNLILSRSGLCDDPDGPAAPPVVCTLGVCPPWGAHQQDAIEAAAAAGIQQKTTPKGQGRGRGKGKGKGQGQGWQPGPAQPQGAGRGFTGMDPGPAPGIAMLGPGGRGAGAAPAVGGGGGRAFAAPPRPSTAGGGGGGGAGAAFPRPTSAAASGGADVAPPPGSIIPVRPEPPRGPMGPPLRGGWHGTRRKSRERLRRRSGRLTMRWPSRRGSPRLLPR